MVGTGRPTRTPVRVRWRCCSSSTASPAVALRAAVARAVAAHALDVTTGAEGRAGAGEDQRADARVVSQAQDHAAQGRRQLVGERVAGLRGRLRVRVATPSRSSPSSRSVPVSIALPDPSTAVSSRDGRHPVVPAFRSASSGSGGRGAGSVPRSARGRRSGLRPPARQSTEGGLTAAPFGAGADRGGDRVRETCLRLSRKAGRTRGVEVYSPTPPGLCWGCGWKGERSPPTLRSRSLRHRKIVQPRPGTTL